MHKLFILVLLFAGINVLAGYNLHIERNDKITVAEWLDICSNDNSLTIQHSAKLKNPSTGEVIEISTPNSCVWISPFLRREYSFTFSNGSIVLGTDKAQVKKAKKIAKLLNAKVVGDQGEEY